VPPPLRGGRLASVIAGTTGPIRQRDLKPITRRGTWVTWGLALQALGLGIPVTVALRRASQDGVLGSFTHYTVRLLWHEMLRDHADVALLVLGVLLFAAGAVIMARPFVRRRSTLLVAIPVAAVAGLVLLGALALVAAVLIALFEAPSNAEGVFSGISWPADCRRKRRK
jgi:hypothetical protein